MTMCRTKVNGKLGLELRKKSFKSSGCWSGIEEKKTGKISLGKDTVDPNSSELLKA